jgi:integral membrane protein (TIGR01906 family)
MSDASASGVTLPGWLIAVGHIIITGALPLLLVLINARLLMLPLFMQWEYNRPNFPPDQWGFTTKDRLEYGGQGLAYLFSNDDISVLANLTFDDGTPLFVERELSHMVDVKVVSQKLVRFGFGLIAVWAVFVVLLALDPAARPTLYRALLFGGILTAALIVVGLIAVATSFNWLFTQFHALFFEGDSWLFHYSDTLIRLYPEQFWIDAFGLMFGGALVEALVLAGMMWRLLRR